MSTENPFSPPQATDNIVRPKRRTIGPILAGLVAIAVATFLMGLGGLFCALLGVGSWWVYKFRPRPPAMEDPGARDFLRRMENAARTADTVLSRVNPSPMGRPRI